MRSIPGAEARVKPTRPYRALCRIALVDGDVTFRRISPIFPDIVQFSPVSRLFAAGRIIRHAARKGKDLKLVECLPGL